MYMVRCSDGTLYTGMASDLAGRIDKHNSGRGAKYTRSRRPVCLVWNERTGSRSSAAKIEAQIKKLSRIEKEELIGRAV